MCFLTYGALECCGFEWEIATAYALGSGSRILKGNGKCRGTFVGIAQTTAKKIFGHLMQSPTDWKGSDAGKD